LLPDKTLFVGHDEQTSGLFEHLSQVDSRHLSQVKVAALKKVLAGHPHVPVNGSYTLP
jgi:hypothetical protein